MIVTVANHQQDIILNEENISRIVNEILRLEGVKTDEVSINFVDMAMICKLHEQYFNDPSFTDCISFPIDSGSEGPYNILGEVFICPLAAIEYATKSGFDPYDETLLYLVHGLLHLAGYDDISDEDAKEMRHAEKRHLERLRKLNLDLRLK